MQDEVISIERIQYHGPVYNLEVEGDHSYVVDGLAVHNCLCFKLAVLMKDDAFIERMRGWLDGSGTWPEMDGYATWLKATRQTLAVALDTVLYEQLALPFINWLDGSEAEADAALGGS